MPELPSGDDIATTPPAAEDRCPVCSAPFTRVRRQRYCSNRCRRRAWRTRHAADRPELPAVPAGRRRSEVTVYECTECETRYLGEQWCAECVRPCRRVGLGGLCPHCEEPVAVPDLLHLEGTVALPAPEVIAMPPG